LRRQREHLSVGGLSGRGLESPGPDRPPDHDRTVDDRHDGAVDPTTVHGIPDDGAERAADDRGGGARALQRDVRSAGDPHPVV
jgi:hypothetical protein